MPSPPDPTHAALDLLTAFLNTLDVDEGTDQLGDAESAGRWLTTRGLLRDDAPVDDEALATVLELRESLRALASGNHDGQVSPAAADRFAAVARRLPLHAEADAGTGEVVLAPAGQGVEAAAGEVVRAAVETSLAGAWSRVKICPADDCDWAFVDRSKNRSRRWCAMGVCGNREKTRAYRERHREAPAQD